MSQLERQLCRLTVRAFAERKACFPRRRDSVRVFAPDCLVALLGSQHCSVKHPLAPHEGEFECYLAGVVNGERLHRVPGA